MSSERAIIVDFRINLFELSCWTTNSCWGEGGIGIPTALVGIGLLNKTTLAKEITKMSFLVLSFALDGIFLTKIKTASRFLETSLSISILSSSVKFDAIE
jgi:hypothetical protein